jgi:ParB family chromosome partitioning protein
MGKLDELMKAAGGAIQESASHRAAPVAMPAGVGIAAGSAPIPGVVRSKAAMEIPVDRIERDPSQPREEFDDEALDRLAGSMKSRGQIQPIAVRLDKGRGVYVIVAGERRWRAAQRAGIPALTCIVHDREVPPGELLALQCVENLLREDLRPVEQARAFRSLMEINGWSGNELAKQIGVAQSTVVVALKLLDLPAAVQGVVEQGGLSPAAAYEVSKLADPREQAEMAAEAVAGKLTRSEVQAAVKAVKARRPAPAARPEPVTIDLGECVVSVKWKKAGTLTGLQALARATRELKVRGRAGESDAA